MSINFNDVDYLGAQFLDLKNAHLSVAHGYARVIVDGHPFHFNRVPKTTDWEGCELKFKDTDAVELNLERPVEIKGHLFTVFNVDRFAILFIGADILEAPVVLRIGAKPQVTEVK